MKKAILVLSITIAIIFIAITGLYLYLNTHFKKDFSVKIKELVLKETDIKIDFKDIDFSFKKLIALKPTLVLKDLEIGEAFFVEEFNIELALKDLLEKKSLNIKKIVINKAILRFEENSQREVFPKGIDLNKLKEKLEEKKKKKKDKKDSLESLISEINLKELHIKDSIYEFTPYKSKSPIKLSNFDLKLSDFVIGDKEEVIAKLKLQAEFFGVKSSNIICNADLGPVNSKMETMPINGSFSINLKIKDLPRDLKNQFLGTAVKISDGSAFKYESSLRGDVFNTMSGSGALKINDLIVGNTTDHTLNVNSSIPLAFVINLMKNPSLALRSNNAHISLKDKNSKTTDLNLTTNVNVNLENMYISGNSAGSLSGLEIEEALNCFTDTRKVISGIFEITNYSVTFSGTDAQQISKNLNANGHIKIKDGSLYILKNIIKYKDYAAAAIDNGGELAEKIAGDFVNLESDFHLTKNLLETDNIIIKSSMAEITGSGTVKKGTWLVYDIVLTAPQLKTPIPMKIRGEVQKPKIYPDIEALAKLNQGRLAKTALQAGLSLLEKEAEKNSKLKGILGAVIQSTNNGQTPSTTTNGSTQTTKPRDILKGQLGTALKGIAQEAVRQGVIKVSNGNDTSLQSNGNSLAP